MKWYLNIILILFLSCSVLATDYTRYSKTDCEVVNGYETCHSTFFNTPTYIIEDNFWIHIKNAKSLKNIPNLYDIFILEDDGVNVIEVIDFNWTSITFKFSAKEDKEHNTKFKVYENGEKIKDKDVKIKKDKTIIYKHDGNFIGKKFHLGMNSTVVEITSTTNDGYLNIYWCNDWDLCRNDAVYGNVHDTGDFLLAESYGSVSTFRLARAYLYFDTSSIPDDAIIEDVELILTTGTPDGTTSNVNVSVQHSDATLTGLEQINLKAYTGPIFGIGRWNDVPGSIVNISFNQNGRDDLNKDGVTRYAIREYDHDYIYLAPPSNHIYAFPFNSSEAANGAPILNVTYAIGADITFNIVDIITGESIPDSNLTIYDSIGDTVYTNASLTAPVILSLGFGNYTAFSSHPNFGNDTETFEVETTDFEVTLSMGFTTTFTFYDEKTLLPFNISSPNSIIFYLFCPNSTNAYFINSSTHNISTDTCDFTKYSFHFFWDTDDVIGSYDSYHRTFLPISENLTDIDVYIPDLRTTEIIFNTFFIDDLLNFIDKPSLLIQKGVGSEIVQIHGDYLDIESKIGAYLMLNSQYEFILRGLNIEDINMGFYNADTTLSKILKAYVISADPEPKGFLNTVKILAFAKNDTGNLVATMVYNDSIGYTNSVNWKIYRDSSNGVLLNEFDNVGDQNIKFTMNIDDWENYTIISFISINHAGIGPYTVVNTIHQNNKIELGIMEYVPQKTLNWFFTILLGTLALMATVRTANFMVLIMFGFAAVFVMFGWYTLSWGVLGIVGILGLVSFLKKENDIAEATR